jgi:hypothetical protein
MNTPQDEVLWHFIESFVFMLSKGEGIGFRSLKK